MATLIAFFVFFVGIAFAVASGISLIYPLALGVIVFSVVALSRGFGLRDIFRMILKGAFGAFPVIRIFALIGFMTGLWRSSGTIAFFVYYGIEFIPPQLFLLFAFLLPALISYLMGSLFGTVSTVGVVLLVLGRSGGINIALLCGAIVSGAIVGDRMAPTSGCCNLTASVNRTRVSDILPRLWARAAVPLALSVAVYGVLSFLNPVSFTDAAIASDILDSYIINLWLAVPALLVLVLPILKVNVRASMAASIVAAALVTLFVQQTPLLSMLRSAIIGYTPVGSGPFSRVIVGGGLLSMVNIAVMVTLACCCTGIFNGTGMLDSAKDLLEKLSYRLGLFPTTLIFSVFANMAFCNQTISLIITEQMVGPVYEAQGRHGKTLAWHMADSTALVGAFVPWNLMCSVPLTTMLCGPLAAMCFYFYPMFQIVCSLIADIIKTNISKKQELR